MVQMLASHFSWIHDLLDKINKDNKETFWRTLGEGLAPETMPTIDSLSEKYVYRFYTHARTRTLTHSCTHTYIHTHAHTHYITYIFHTQAHSLTKTVNIESFASRASHPISHAVHYQCAGKEEEKVNTILTSSH